MSGFECMNCGASIHREQAQFCPRCGHNQLVMQAENEMGHACAYCLRAVSGHALYCPHCHAMNPINTKKVDEFIQALRNRPQVLSARPRAVRVLPSKPLPPFLRNMSPFMLDEKTRMARVAPNLSRMETEWQQNASTVLIRLLVLIGYIVFLFLLPAPLSSCLFAILVLFIIARAGYPN